MALKPLITLPPDLVERSLKFAVQAVSDMKAELYPASSAVSCFGAEKNVGLWHRSKMAECAFCLWVGGDIEKIHWKRGPDKGDDIVWRGLRWDVKTTEMHKRCLVWPLGKNDIFESKEFDMLALVKNMVVENKPPVFQVTGFVSKERFRKEKKIAGPNHFLAEGTWFMQQDTLAEPAHADRLIIAEALIEAAARIP